MEGALAIAAVIILGGRRLESAALELLEPAIRCSMLLCSLAISEQHRSAVHQSSHRRTASLRKDASSALVAGFPAR
jgi:hypothetical protein